MIHCLCVCNGRCADQSCVKTCPQVKKVLNDVEQLLQPPQLEPQTAELTVRIACANYAMRAVIVPFLHLLKIQAPKIKVPVLAINESAMQNQLEQRKIVLHW